MYVDVSWEFMNFWSVEEARYVLEERDSHPPRQKRRTLINISETFTCRHHFFIVHMKAVHFNWPKSKHDIHKFMKIASKNKLAASQIFFLPLAVEQATHGIYPNKICIWMSLCTHAGESPLHTKRLTITEVVQKANNRI
jgi:hypothetical protein